MGWTAADRSDATHRRAQDAGFTVYPALNSLLAHSDIVLSICPPAAAGETAAAVAATGFSSLYCDANAISPDRAAQIAALVERGGGHYVDGGIIGPPAVSAGTTRLYLSGARAQKVASLFTHTLLDAIVIEGAHTAASTLKMCYAGWTKGSAALLLAVAALAQASDVQEVLQAEWSQSLPGLPAELAETARRDFPKAWRFSAEMQEIAATFAQYSLPRGFHDAAADLFARLARYANTTPTEDLNALLAAIATLGAEHSHPAKDQQPLEKET